MKREDMEGPPCQCPACFQAGMTTKPQRRDPRTGELLHGEALRRWYVAREKFLKLAKEKLGLEPKDFGVGR